MTMLRLRRPRPVCCGSPASPSSRRDRARDQPVARSPSSTRSQGEATLAAAVRRSPAPASLRPPSGRGGRGGRAGVSRLALAFANGRRYELGGRSRVTLGSADLSARSGPVRPLPRVPPLPRLAADRGGGRGRAVAGAVRIRGERMTGLYPDHWATTLARATTLRFAPVAGARRYRIEVHDRQGKMVFAIETAASENRLHKTYGP